MLLTNSNCLAGPKDSRVLTSSPLNRRSVRECVPDGARMLPPTLYLVVFLSSELGEPDRVNLFGLQKDLWKYFLEVLVVLYHMFIPHGGVVINVLA